MNKYTSQKYLTSKQCSMKLQPSSNIKQIDNHYINRPTSPQKIQLSPKNLINNKIQQHQSKPVNLNFQSLHFRRLQSQNKQSKFQSPVLNIILICQNENFKDNFLYSYNNETNVQQLKQVIYKKVALILKLRNKQKQGRLIYFKTGNIHLDYFLSLKQRKLKEIPWQKLVIRVYKINQQILKLGKSLKMFQIIKCIGSGGFSKVYIGRVYGLILAIKIISKDFILKSGKQSIIQNQKYILEISGNHPFLTKLHLTLETDKFILFAMEYYNGGQLFHLLRKVKRMKECQARFYFLQILAAISFLHKKNIIYRDLKPQNVILDYDGHVKLADFGLSKIMREQRTYSFCGSAQYMAPQMLLKKGHGFQIDFYCLGALLYELVTGLPPHYSTDQQELFNNILYNDLTFESYSGYCISKELKTFLKRLLTKDPDVRFKKIQEMFTYDWLKGFSLQNVISKKMVPPFPTKMFQYNFDDQQFRNQQQQQIQKLQNQKLNQNHKSSVLVNFDYESQQIKKIKKTIQQQANIRDFVKKQIQYITIPSQNIFTTPNSKLNNQQNNHQRQFQNKMTNKQIKLQFKKNIQPLKLSNQLCLNSARSMEKLQHYHSVSPKINEKYLSYLNVKNNGSQIQKNLLKVKNQAKSPNNLLSKIKAPQTIQIIKTQSYKCQEKNKNNDSKCMISFNLKKISAIQSLNQSNSKQKSFSQRTYDNLQIIKKNSNNQQQNRNYIGSYHTLTSSQYLLKIRQISKNNNVSQLYKLDSLYDTSTKYRNDKKL